jgi:hypothetical protein
MLETNRDRTILCWAHALSGVCLLQENHAYCEPAVVNCNYDYDGSDDDNDDTSFIRMLSNGKAPVNEDTQNAQF